MSRLPIGATQAGAQRDIPTVLEFTEFRMNTGAHLGPIANPTASPHVQSNMTSEPLAQHRTLPLGVNSRAKLQANSVPNAQEGIRVFVAAENRLLREALAKILVERGSLEIAGLNSPSGFNVGTPAGEGVQVLLLVSQGSIQSDLATIQRVHSAAPIVRILLIGSTKLAGEFLQCVRAGISGYLWRDASADDVLLAVRAVHAGEAVCPGELCNVLFRYFERETSELPCASPPQRLGLTRREQQLVPLIAKGFTNKEIANHFCLSEQTVKNHLYRMKHKIGAEDRLNIVQRFRTQGFLLQS
jgi:DNA-binding NarL/FixJ family response regulator